MLRVRLLGGLSLAWNQSPLPMSLSHAARSLFAYLVTYRDRPHTRDLLIGVFWPDLPETTARRRLSKALWQIRRILQNDQIPHAPPILVAEGDTLQLSPNLPIWLDVEEFIRCSKQCAGGEAGAIEYCQSCITHYQGEFLAGYHDDWTVLERERLREIFLATLAQLVEKHKSRGEYDHALRYARRLAVEDPWREEAHREAMRLFHLLGQDAEALNQFEVCRHTLAEELGIEPSPETTALADEIATRSELLEPPHLPSAARPMIAPYLERPDQVPLVGRQKELAELLHQVESAVAGNGGLIIIYGEAGVGKSRLLRELALNVQWRGLHMVWGRCYELATPLPYLPLVEALRASLTALNDSDLKLLWRAELSRLLPELAVEAGLPPPLSPEEEKHRLLEAITRAFIALAERAPHLVLLEDVHWMDPASLEVLYYLLPRLVETRLLFVGTVRPEELAGQ
jgi:DNA-binding SARP family transcriptional activator